MLVVGVHALLDSLARFGGHVDHAAVADLAPSPFGAARDGSSHVQHEERLAGSRLAVQDPDFRLRQHAFDDPGRAEVVLFVLSPFVNREGVSPTVGARLVLFLARPRGLPKLLDQTANRFRRVGTLSKRFPNRGFRLGIPLRTVRRPRVPDLEPFTLAFVLMVQYATCPHPLVTRIAIHLVDKPFDLATRQISYWLAAEDIVRFRTVLNISIWRSA